MPWNNGGNNGQPPDDPPKGDTPNPPPNPWGAPGGRRPASGPKPVPDRPQAGPTERPSGPRPVFGQKPPGSSGGSGSPWGGNGGGGPKLPDAGPLLDQMRSWFRGFGPPGNRPNGGSGSGGGGWGGWLSGPRLWGVLVALVAVVWLASGFYRVQPDQQGVVLRFGAYIGITQPGLNYHLPWPIEEVMLPATTRINRTEIGYRSAGSPDRVAAGDDLPMRPVPQESLMLTGDENIIDIDFAVFWHISSPSAYLFNTRNPEAAVKAVAESVMREVIGSTPIQPALAEARARIETAVMTGTQSVLDQYGTGVEITQVQLQRVDPPAAVIDSFRDVQRANTDADRARNEAETYRNDILPRARGEAARIVAEADGARQAAIAEANGARQRFLSVLTAYQAARDVTLRRLYIETMQDVLTHAPSVVMDDSLKGVVPLLGLPAGNAAAPAQPPPAHPSSALYPGGADALAVPLGGLSGGGAP